MVAELKVECETVCGAERSGRRFERVAVLMGGASSESDISLDSGHAVVAGLRAAGYPAVAVPVGRCLPEMPPGIEAVFVALHGAYGEDGGVQADLDRLRMPYTGSGATASRAAFDKIESKRRFDVLGIPTAPWQVLCAGQNRVDLSVPLVVKPPCEGSSTGVQWVFDRSELPAALAAVRAHSDTVLVESYIAGREWTVGLLDGETLPVVAIHSPGDRYDRTAKYTPDYCTYRVIREDDCEDAGPAAVCRTLARRVFDVLGARGVGRVDFRVSPQGRPYVLELNTIPGFTPTSLLPKAAAAAGLPFPELCRRIMEGAAFDPVTAGERS